MSSRGGKKKSTKTSRSAKAGVIFPVGRMLRYIKKGHPKYRIGVGAPVYMAAVLEYLTGEYSSQQPPGQTWQLCGLFRDLNDDFLLTDALSTPGGVRE